MVRCVVPRRRRRGVEVHADRLREERSLRHGGGCGQAIRVDRDRPFMGDPVDCEGTEIPPGRSSTTSAVHTRKQTDALGNHTHSIQFPAWAQPRHMLQRSSLTDMI